VAFVGESTTFSKDGEEGILFNVRNNTVNIIVGMLCIIGIFLF
jgi:hypothetical protein